MTIKGQDFSEEDKMKILLWCDRHCCLCGKQCSTNIIIHHIEQEIENRSDVDNAIPLCLECHGKIRSYDPKHPVGTKYKVKEIKARRDQIYERYTRHLVPPIEYEPLPIYYEKKNKPRVGFKIGNLGDSLRAKAKVTIKAYLGDKDLGPIMITKRPYYSGEMIWNLNPRKTIFGNFPIPKECVDNTEKFRLEVQVTIIDIYNRPHEYLPVCYTYARKQNVWSLEPASFSDFKRFMS